MNLFRFDRRKYSVVILFVAMGLIALNTSCTKADPSNIVEAGTVFKRGDFINSSNGLYKFGLNKEGNLVLMKDKEIVWSTGNINGVEAKLQGDGNFLVKDKTSPNSVWKTNTTNYPNAYLTIEDNGLVTLISEAGVVYWCISDPEVLDKCPDGLNIQGL